MSGSIVRPVVRRAALSLLGESGYERLRVRSVARDIRSGHWTEPEVPLVPLVVAPGDTVVDVGANFGMYCFHLSRAVGPQGTVEAFEPVPATCANLRRVVRLLALENVRIVEAGASDTAGVAEMAVPRRGDGSAEAGKAWAVRAEAASVLDAVRARMLRLDDALDGVEVTFMKCDVEGTELFALRGASRLLEEHAPTLVLETSRATMSRYGLVPEQLQELLEEFAYATYRFRDGRLHRGAAGDLDANLVAVHERRADRVRAVLA